MTPPRTPLDPSDDDLEQGSLLDLVDHLLDQGVVLQGEVIIGLAGIDLVYLRLSALLAPADRILGDGRAAAGGARPGSNGGAP